MLRRSRRRVAILPRNDDSGSLSFPFQIFGQERASRILGGALGRPSHAYLFHGPRGTGRLEAAMRFAAALLYPDEGDSSPLRQAVVLGKNPDVRFWAPDGRTTKIEQVRELIRAAELGAFQSAWKVHVLDAGSLTNEGANCLLKTLEEPVPGTVLVLLAESLDRILPTLVSRCQPVPFRLLPAAFLEKILIERGISEEIAHWASALADGRLSKALELAAGPPPSPSPFLQSKSLLAVMQEGERLAALSEEEQQGALESMIAQVRDIIVWRETRNPASVAFPGLPAAFEGVRQTTWEWLGVMDRLVETRRGMFSHANSKLMWAALATEIARG